MTINIFDPQTGAQRAMLDLAWPNGVQEELTEPVAVLLDEGSELISLASTSGFRCFTSVDAFKSYVASLEAPVVDAAE